MSETVRFWSQVHRADADSCWPWTGKKIKGGYGDFVRFVDGVWTHTIAHRWSWTEVNGSIPDGLYVLHRCDNPPCVNPAHLFLGTALDNEQDKIAKGRRAPTAGEGNPNHRLEPADIKEIRRLMNEERVPLRDIARRFNLDPSHASRIAKGKMWSHIALTSPPVDGRRGRPRKRRDPSAPIRCGRCHAVKEPEAFYPSQVERGNGYCIACMLVWNRERYARRKGEQAANA